MFIGVQTLLKTCLYEGKRPVHKKLIVRRISITKLQVIKDNLILVVKGSVNIAVQIKNFSKIDK